MLIGRAAAPAIGAGVGSGPIRGAVDMAGGTLDWDKGRPIIARARPDSQ